MSETKWTPGPWAWMELFNPRPIDVFSLVADPRYLRTGNGGDVIEATVDRDGSPYIGCANPHDLALIAAAPDLYEALDNAVILMSALTGPDDAIAKATLSAARAALAKARGDGQ